MFRLLLISITDLEFFFYLVIEYVMEYLVFFFRVAYLNDWIKDTIQGKQYNSYMLNL